MIQQMSKRPSRSQPNSQPNTPRSHKSPRGAPPGTGNPALTCALNNDLVGLIKYYLENDVLLKSRRHKLAGSLIAARLSEDMKKERPPTIKL